jgi:hypothetical protein
LGQSSSWDMNWRLPKNKAAVVTTISLWLGDWRKQRKYVHIDGCFLGTSLIWLG